MNKYELATELAKLANELFKEGTKLLNIEEGFIDYTKNFIFTNDVKYIFKIYMKFIPIEANQRSDKEALALRILVKRKVG